MTELIRLAFLIVVILPLSLLFIGPLLVLAALRGRQHIGPFVLDPGRWGAAVRVQALLLGLLAWLIVWGGLALLLTWIGLPRVSGLVTYLPQGLAAPTSAPAAPTPTATPLPEVILEPSAQAGPSLEASPSAPAPAASATPIAMQPSPTPEASTPTPTPVPASPTPTLAPPTPTALATPIPVATPAPELTPTPLPAATLAPWLRPIGTPSPQEAAELVAAVEAANELLRTAVLDTSIANLALMETLWQGQALARAQAFVQDLDQRYQTLQGVNVSYRLPQVVLGGAEADTALVISTETWVYQGRLSSYEETFEFTYILARQDEGWVITDYRYANAPGVLLSGESSPRPAPPITQIVTTTTIITSGVQ